MDEYNFLFISIITYIEIFGYQFTNDDEKLLIKNIIENIPIINVDLKIAEIAIEYRRKRKTKLPDALILATVKSTNSILITRNDNDFVNVDNSIIIVQPKILL